MSPRLLALNIFMRKFAPYTIGILLGIVMSMASMYSGVFTAHSTVSPEEAKEWWNNDVVANMQTWEWKDVFGKVSRDKNDTWGLYQMMNNKLLQEPGSKALELMAAKHGITVDEADALASGSISAAATNIKAGSTLFDDKDTAHIARIYQQEYNEFLQLFEIQQEMEMEIAPSEIFSNGDLEDSGFDLIVDLDKIEYILFIDQTETDIEIQPLGDLIDDLENLFDALDGDDDDDNDNGGGGGGGNNGNIGDDDDSDDDDDDGGDDDDDDNDDSYDPLLGNNVNIEYDGDTAMLSMPGQSIEVEILEEDVCPTEEDDLLSALGEYEEENKDLNKGKIPKDEKKKKVKPGDDDDNDSDDDDDNDDNDDDSGDDDDESAAAPGPPIIADPADPSEWGSLFCPEMGGFDVSGWEGATLDDVAGIGDVSGGYSTGGSASYEDEEQGISASAQFCIMLEMISGAVTSGQSKESGCIMCEVEIINGILEETLSFTMRPNKTTGNIFENAKCSTSMSAVSVDMKLVLIAAPILTPPNDDLIFESNIFEEWNNVVDEMGYTDSKAKVATKYLQDMVIKYPETDTTHFQMMEKVRAAVAHNQNLAIAKFEATEDVAYLESLSVYSDTVLTEMKQMTNYFENFYNKFLEIHLGPCSGEFSTTGEGLNTKPVGCF